VKPSPESILLQVIANLATQDISVLYVSGEESLQQIAERAIRLGLPLNKINMLTETSVQSICNTLDELKPKILVIDSIQVMHTQTSESTPGSFLSARSTLNRASSVEARINWVSTIWLKVIGPAKDWSFVT
jgi:DNA repair protein RadA/Sms